MGKVFDDVKLIWDGTEFTIPSNQVMGAIARVEDILTLAELGKMLRSSANIKVSKIATAYGALLRYASASVTDDEVYRGLFQVPEDGSESPQSITQAALLALLSLMIPDSVSSKPVKNQEKTPGKKTPTAAGSSRKRSS